jgi:hypothetical protein
MGYLNGAGRVPAKDFGVAMNKRRAECESQQQNNRDSGQSPVGDRLALALCVMGLRAMAAGMQKAMLESPILRQIIPAVRIPITSDVDPSSRYCH